MMVILEPAQIFQLIRSLAAILLTPAIARLICDVDLADSISAHGPLSSQNFNLLKLRYNLCRFVV
tara:strand:+ start:558 stop:752 length:195 start_codon:yes stop_codon:yes gene_type:complete